VVYSISLRLVREELKKITSFRKLSTF